MRMIHGKDVFGVDVDANSRCAHWNSELDIIALRFKCCGRWYSCFDCHQALADHVAEVWPRSERDANAVLCGGCGSQLSINEYLNCNSTCPKCMAAFNPGCAKHYHLYFE